MESIERIQRTYGGEDLAHKLLQSLSVAGCDLSALTTADLIAFDELHIMGRQATVELGRRAGLAAAMQVLDIGCGVGGPARTLAEHFGCRVVGVDLSESFVGAAAALTRQVGLAERVDFRLGDALHLPFADDTFDAAVMLHLSMNIVDKAGLFRDARRVLKSGGRLALWEVCRGEGEIIFPVPWADDDAFSHLAPMDDLLAQLHASGFVKTEWEDATQQAAQWVRQRVQATGTRSAERKTPDLDLVLPDFRRKRANISHNLLQGKIRVLRAVATAPAEHGGI
jgi:ubiquinone/menaquinone biosynthesis C-methylase UbiE